MMKRMQDQPEVDLPNLAAPSAGDAMSETRRRVVEQEARVALAARALSRGHARGRERARDAEDHARHAAKTGERARRRLGVPHPSLEAGLAVVNHDIAEQRAAIATMPDKEVTLAEMDLRSAC